MNAQLEPTLEEVVDRAIELFNASDGVKLYPWDDYEQFFEYARPYEAADAVRDALKELGAAVEPEPQSGWLQGGIQIDYAWPEAEELVIARIPHYKAKLELHRRAASEYEATHGR